MEDDVWHLDHKQSEHGDDDGGAGIGGVAEVRYGVRGAQCHGAPAHLPTGNLPLRKGYFGQLFGAWGDEFEDFQQAKVGCDDDHEPKRAEETAARPHLLGLVGVCHPAFAVVLALVVSLRFPAVPTLVVEQSSSPTVAPHTGGVAWAVQGSSK